LDELRGELAALGFSLVAFAHQRAEPQHLVIDGLKSRPVAEEFFESLGLGLGESVWAFAQCGGPTPVMFEVWSDLSAQFHEVVLDESDDMEAVRDDAGLGEVVFDQRAVAGAHVDAHEAHLILSLKGFEEGLEVWGAFALGDIKDAVAFEIAEGGGEPAALVEGVFINAEHPRALAREPFTGLAAGEPVIDALDSRTAQLSEFGQPGSADAVVVVAMDTLSERL